MYHNDPKYMTLDDAFVVTAEQTLDKEYEMEKKKVGRKFQKAWEEKQGGKDGWKKSHGGE